MNQIAKDILASIDASPEMIKLNKTKHRDYFQDERSDILNYFYDQKHRIMMPKILGSIYNSIFTQNRLVFLFSKQILIDLIKNDPNVKRKSIRGDEYKRIFLELKSSGQFKVVDGCEMRKGKNLASVLECCNPAIIRIVAARLCEDVVSVQRQQAIELYNEMYQSTQQSTPDSDNESDSVGATEGGLGEFNSCPKGRIKNNSPHSLRREQIHYLSNRSKPSINEIYQAWLSSVSQSISQRKSDVERLLQSIQESGFTSDDLPSGFKQKVLAVFVPSVKPKSCSQEKYQIWLDLSERDYDSCFGEIFLNGLVIQDNQNPNHDSDHDKQLEDLFYSQLGIQKENNND